jgi:hypothetical protein
VTGLDVTAIGDIAARRRIAIHGLTPHAASLETAYLHLTRDHLDFPTAPTSENRDTTTPSTGSDQVR